MKKNSNSQQEIDAMEVDEELTETPLEPNSDLCQTLMERYGNSSAPQHRHLCASAAAMRAILQEEGLPSTPPAYFAATISAIDDASESLDSDATAALSSFLSMLLPLVPAESVPPSKAIDAVSVLVALLQRPSEAVSSSALRCVIKSLGILVQFCDLEDWDAVKVPFETILGFSVDKRPKIRRCAQVCLEKVFKSLHSSISIKEASNLVLHLFERYMPQVNELGSAKVLDGSKPAKIFKPDHLEFVHMLNSLKIVVPYMSKKASLKVLSFLYKLVTPHFSPHTRYVFSVLEVLFESSRADVVVPQAENYILSLVSYVSAAEKNPMDTVISASILLRSVLGKLYATDPNICTRNLPAIFHCIAGLLLFEHSASQAAGILKALICKHIRNTFWGSENQVYNEKTIDAAESRAIESTCAVFQNVLCSFNGIPNEHTLAVISDLLLNLGELSQYFLNDTVLKLAELMMLANRDMSARKHLEECIGSAVVSMGPEKILTLIPVSLHADKLTCSNVWLVPILKKNVVGASLKYFMDHILPLIETLQRASKKVKKSSLQQDLQICIRDLWDLLPAFCRYPNDTYKSCEPLAKVFTAFLKEDSYMHENIAFALQELVKQNKSALRSTETLSGSVNYLACNPVEESNKEPGRVSSLYSKKFAKKNIKALASCSAGLLDVLTDLFFKSPPEKRTYLKEAIGCLASITDSSDVKKLFISLLEKLKFINEVSDVEKMDASDDKDTGDAKSKENDNSQRCLIMEFASSIVDGADEDLVNTIYEYVKSALEVTLASGQTEAYRALSRILLEHTWFYTSRLDEIMVLLLGIKSPVDIMCMRSRFACLHTLLIYLLKLNLDIASENLLSVVYHVLLCLVEADKIKSVISFKYSKSYLNTDYFQRIYSLGHYTALRSVFKSDLDEKNAKAFLILNEIVLALKHSNEEARKVAYDVLLRISGSLMDSSSATSVSSHQQLCSMILGYLSGAPPSIMSGAVAALSLLIYENSDICLSVEELVPSVLALLQSKANEVIKVVLGFVKVLVSCLKASDLQKLLPDILERILPWSSVSRHHFRSKVTVILEIIIRKCGSASVESLAPDKYKGFIKNVKEQRHGKTHSKDAVLSDATSNRNEKDKQELTRSGTSSTAPKENITKKRKFPKENDNEPFKSAGIGRGSLMKHETKHSHSDNFVRKARISGKQVRNGFQKAKYGRKGKNGAEST